MTPPFEARFAGLIRVGLVLLLAAAVGTVYWPALQGSWLWDDGLEIAGNATVHSPSGWWLAWARPEGMDYFPLKGTFQWLEWRLWGEATVGYHVAAVLLHLGAALLLWRALAELGLRHGWVAAFLFAVHPVAVESVAWVSEQKNGLSLVFALAALIAYLRAEKLPRSASNLAALALFAAALLCKSTVVMLPPLLLLLAWWRRGRLALADLRRTAPFFLLSLVLGVVTIVFQHHRAIGLNGPMPGLGERLVQVAPSLLAYLRDQILPFWLAVIASPVTASVAAWLALVVLAAVGTGVLVAQRGSTGRGAALGAAAFALVLAPVLGVLPMSYLRIAPRADHLAYLGLPVSMAVLGTGLGALMFSPRRGLAFVGRLLFLAVFGIYLNLARAHAADFRSPESLWRAAVAGNPGSWLAQNNLGLALLEKGDATAALAHLDRASGLKSDSAEVRLNRANALEQAGRVSEALAEARAATQLDATLPGAHYAFGRLLLNGGNPAGAIQELRLATDLDPGYASAHNNLGLAFARTGRPSEAAREFQAAIQADPRNAEAHVNLGNLAARAGDLDGALAQYRAALGINPGYGPARQNEAAVLRAQGRSQ